ncbi:MAG: alkaline shock response membrane anchor protein AmaP [Candidatus Omnitrophica bacterium]|nr:alkaline shock response membrane anchor protein AmaP [Candidatus Omnitrophota bacterium]
MRFFTILGVLFYTIILFLIGGVLIAFAFNWLPLETIPAIIEFLNSSLNSRIITGLSGFLLIVISISFAQIILGRMERERTVAFNTPSGQVTVALSAVEDLIKRITTDFAEIKEMRPDVIATKKGVEVNLRVVLQSEVSIPDLISHLQDVIKDKIQGMLGIEEEIKVLVHVVKIVGMPDSKLKDAELQKETMPFSSYSKT